MSKIEENAKNETDLLIEDKRSEAVTMAPFLAYLEVYISPQSVGV